MVTGLVCLALTFCVEIPARLALIQVGTRDLEHSIQSVFLPMEKRALESKHRGSGYVDNHR